MCLQYTTLILLSREGSAGGDADDSADSPESLAYAALSGGKEYWHLLLLMNADVRFEPSSGSSAGSLMREECKWKISLAANDQTSFRFGYTKCYDPVLGMLGFSKKRMIKSGELKTCHMWQDLL